MKIESVSATPDRAGCYWVKFSDGSKMRLYRQTLEDFALYPGAELSPEQMEKLRHAASRMSAKMRAVRIISASAVSASDLETRLVRKGEEPEEAQEAVQWLQQMNLLDDQKTAAQIVQRCIRKGYGIGRARQALYEKQIPREYWDEVLEEYPEQEEAIREFLEDRLSRDPSPKGQNRAVQALIRRGHSYETIKHILRQLEDCFQEE